MSKKEEYYFGLVTNFFLRKKEHDREQKEFGQAKENFYSAMDEVFDTSKLRTEINFDCVCGYDECESDELVVKRVSKTRTTYDIPLLRSILRSDWRKVIKRKYTITDISGLTAYLRACGVDAKKFKSFIHIEESVDEKVLDQMLNVGAVRIEDVRPAMKIEEVSRYYKITEV